MHNKVLVLVYFLLFSSHLSYSQERTVVRFGDDITVQPGEQVKDAVAVGGSVHINGEVTNDAVAVGGSLFLSNSAFVGGSAVAIGGRVSREPGSVIQGDMVEIGAPWRDMPPQRWHQIFLGMRIAGFVGLVALSLLVVALFPKQIHHIYKFLKTSPAKSLLWGVVAWIAITPAIFVLVLSIIGVALIPLLVTAFVLALFIGYIAVALYAGTALFKAAQKPETPILWRTFAGLLILGAIGFIPIIGELFGAVVSVFGLGAVLETLIRSRAGKKRLA